MSPIPSVPSGQRLHRVTLQNPGTPVPDGDGGFTTPWMNLVPPVVFARITPATARDLERVTAGTVLTTASHLVAIPYMPNVSPKTRILFGQRVLQISGVQNPEERNVELLLACIEVEGETP